MRRLLARWGALLCSLGILAVIYAHIDLGQLVARLIKADPLWLGTALICFAPQIVLTATRWWLMMDGIAQMGWIESARMVLAGKALNALLPSKLGEMSKAYFLRQMGGVHISRSLPAVVLEKVLDLAGLCFWMLLGALLSPKASGPVMVGGLVSLGVLGATCLSLGLPLKVLGERFFRGSGGLGSRIGKVVAGWDSVVDTWRKNSVRLAQILVLSVLLWGFHLVQIYLFFPVLRQPMDPIVAATYVPLSLLVGLLPISMAGMGTRDTALILLFAPYADAATMAGIGLLCTMRYWADTLVGVPFLHSYAARIGSQVTSESST